MSDTERKDMETAGAFLTFMLDYYALIRRHMVETNQFRIHSHCFSLLYALRMNRLSGGDSFGMSQCADEVGVTKQQLTKLVTDLEKMSLVEREHQSENRRYVKVAITDEGMRELDAMLGEITGEIISSLAYFSDADKDRIKTCSDELSDIFRRDKENR